MIDGKTTNIRSMLLKTEFAFICIKRVLPGWQGEVNEGDFGGDLWRVVWIW